MQSYVKIILAMARMGGIEGWGEHKNSLLWWNGTQSNAPINKLVLEKERLVVNCRHIQGGFFNWSAQISVLKRKTLFDQRGSFVHRKFHGTESLIGCSSFFILVLKIGRNSWKKHPVTWSCEQLDLSVIMWIFFKLSCTSVLIYNN